jgi:hypothetical protein
MMVIAPPSILPAAVNKNVRVLPVLPAITEVGVTVHVPDPSVAGGAPALTGTASIMLMPSTSTKATQTLRILLFIESPLYINIILLATSVLCCN